MKTKLTKKELYALKKECGSVEFPYSFEFAYEKQIPNTAIAILHGEILLLKNKQPLEKMGDGTLIGVDNLLKGFPLKETWKVIKNSEVILLNRSAILRALENQDSQIHWLKKKINF